MLTSEDELRMCERGDHGFDVLLGDNLQTATLRLGLILAAVIIVATTLGDMFAA